MCSVKKGIFVEHISSLRGSHCHRGECPRKPRAFPFLSFGTCMCGRLCGLPNTVALKADRNFPVRLFNPETAGLSTILASGQRRERRTKRRAACRAWAGGSYLLRSPGGSGAELAHHYFSARWKPRPPTPKFHHIHASRPPSCWTERWKRHDSSRGDKGLRAVWADAHCRS